MHRSAQQAAELLWTCRRSGTVIDALPSALRPHDTAAGHAIQAALPVVAGRPVISWKIAAKSAAGQAHVQVDGPLAGRILEDFVQPIGATLSLVGNRMRVVEPEFAFRMGSDLPPRATPYTVGEVVAAVASLHAAFELPDSRYSDFASAGMAQLIADNVCCGVSAFGPASPPMWREVDLAAHRVHATVRGADGSVRYTRDGEGRALLGDPRIALTWLATSCRRSASACAPAIGRVAALAWCRWRSCRAIMWRPTTARSGGLRSRSGSARTDPDQGPG